MVGGKRCAKQNRKGLICKTGGLNPTTDRKRLKALSWGSLKAESEARTRMQGVYWEVNSKKPGQGAGNLRTDSPGKNHEYEG